MEDTSKSFFLASKADLQNELSKTKHSFLSAQVFPDIHKMPKYVWMFVRKNRTKIRSVRVIHLTPGSVYRDSRFNNLNMTWYFLI